MYVVKEGDICSSVAKKAGIPLGVLFKNNPNINKGCTNIYPEEVSLSLHKGVCMYAMIAGNLTNHFDRMVIILGSLRCPSG